MENYIKYFNQNVLVKGMLWKIIYFIFTCSKLILSNKCRKYIFIIIDRILLEKYCVNIIKKKIEK